MSLALTRTPGDDRWVQEMFAVVWEDHKRGGKGLTFDELREQARLRFNTSATIQRYAEDFGCNPFDNSTTDGPNVVELTGHVDRASLEWRDVSAAIWAKVFDRMKTNSTGKGPARDRLIVSGRGRGRPTPTDQEIRWRVNVREGQPVLPRYHRKAMSAPAQWVNFDPEADRQGIDAHQEIRAWLHEAREELARPGKRRPAERDALLERAVELLSAR